MHAPTDSAATRRQFLTCILLLWLAGIGLRVTVLAVPPVIPLILACLKHSTLQLNPLVTAARINRRANGRKRLTISCISIILVTPGPNKLPIGLRINRTFAIFHHEPLSFQGISTPHTQKGRLVWNFDLSASHCRIGKS